MLKLIICGVLLFSISCAGAFDLGEVRFFEEPKEDRGAEEEGGIEDLWTEPVIGPDGRVAYYRPPEAVLQFIENPTEENAEAYLEWNRKRFEAYLKAQEVLRESIGKIEREGGFDAQKTESLAVGPLRQPSHSSLARVLYFIDPACAYCEKQAPIVNEFYSRYNKELKIEGITLAPDIEEISRQFAFPVSRDAGEIQRFGISTYPTMIFSLPSGRVFGIRGFAGREQLEQIWKENRGS